MKVVISQIIVSLFTTVNAFNRPTRSRLNLTPNLLFHILWSTGSIHHNFLNQAICLEGKNVKVEGSFRRGQIFKKSKIRHPFSLSPFCMEI